MSTNEHASGSFRAPMAWKFFLLMALIVPSMLAVSWVGGRGMRDMKARLDMLYADTLRPSRTSDCSMVAGTSPRASASRCSRRTIPTRLD